MREFSDQKLRSTSRNRGLPPSQPTASKIASRIIGQSPVYEKLIFPNTFTAQAEAISGDRPSTRHGTTSITNQAVRSFGRLISESNPRPLTAPSAAIDKKSSTAADDFPSRRTSGDVMPPEGSRDSAMEYYRTAAIKKPVANRFMACESSCGWDGR